MTSLIPDSSSDHQRVNTSQSTLEIPTLPDSPKIPTMATDHSSCVDCSAMYARSMDLQRHVKQSCPEADSETDSEAPPQKMLRVEEESDEPAFEDLINEAYDKYDDHYNEKVNKFKDDGLSDERATQAVSEMLRPKYRKALMKKYKTFLETLYYIKHSLCITWCGKLLGTM